MLDNARAVRDGKITAANVTSLKKALNADWRRRRGYWVSTTAPKLQGDDLRCLLVAIERNPPEITGALHDSGVRTLNNPRYRRRLAAVQGVVNTLARFRLVGFDCDDNGNHVPVYRAEGDAGAFDFINPSWRSGGKGPDIIA